jgi:hypothetical protein
MHRQTLTDRTKPGPSFQIWKMLHARGELTMQYLAIQFNLELKTWSKTTFRLVHPKKIFFLNFSLCAVPNVVKPFPPNFFAAKFLPPIFAVKFLPPIFVANICRQSFPSNFLKISNFF